MKKEQIDGHLVEIGSNFTDECLLQLFTAHFASRFHIKSSEGIDCVEFGRLANEALPELLDVHLLL